MDYAGTAQTVGAHAYGNLRLSGSGNKTLASSATAGTLDITGSAKLNQSYADPVRSAATALTLGGTNTYAGGTTVSAGSLIGNTTSLQGAITNNAAVTFDQASSGTYAGNMSGSGSLTKLGAGSLTLSGTNTYTGGTTVSAGTLIGKPGNREIAAKRTSDSISWRCQSRCLLPKSRENLTNNSRWSPGWSRA